MPETPKPLVWDQVGERLYETGTRKGVLYVQDASGMYPKGVAWNGLTAIKEKPTGADANKQYANDSLYLNLRGSEEFDCTIEAFTYPDEWAACDGCASPMKGVYFGQQPRKPFGLCWRTVLGNDVEYEEYGYTLHFAYGLTASPSEKDYATVNDSPEAMTMSWECSATKVEVPGYRPLASFSVRSIDVTEAQMAALEKVIYGSSEAEARLPMPAEIVEILKGAETE